MDSTFKIDGCEHLMHNGQLFLKNKNHYPTFQEDLKNFKKQIIEQVENKSSKSYVHFGDGDYYFLKKRAVGSASPGKRALSIKYNHFDITPFKEGWAKADYHCVEYLENGMREKLNELYPNQKTIPTEFLYGLTSNKWFFKTFPGKIGLIGASEKLNLIKELMNYKQYQEYLGLESFNDYIHIPQKFACDDLSKTISMVKEQLEKANNETRIFLFGVGHVKSGLIHHLPKIKNALYIDVGSYIDAIAGIMDPERPYAYAWINHRIKNYNYDNIDLLQYHKNKDKNLILLD